MGEEEEDHVATTNSRTENKEEGGGGCLRLMWGPINWVRLLAMEMHWSFVFGVVVIYGISQGLGGAFAKVGTEYYMKDVQKVQPSEAQVYSGITLIPWLVKPLWGLLTDVVPISGYRRRPYFAIAGVIGIMSMMFLSIHKDLHIALALISLTAGSAGVAIADVTIDACVAQNSSSHSSLAADMQSLCALSSSIGSLLGFSLSGFFVHLIGPTGVYGLLSIPAALVFLVGIVLKEPHASSFSYGREKFFDALKAMWLALKCPDVWRPCLYMYLSFALSLNVREGLFYWSTDSDAGPSFSQETIGFVLSTGSVGGLLGAILYQYRLNNYPFKDLLFWTQLCFAIAGMLDLMLVLRLNLKLGIPDYFFVVVDEIVSQLTGRLKKLPLLVLASQLCPAGIEGTFFAFLMSIENFGFLSSTWEGGILLQLLKVSRKQFDKLWLAILIRYILRLTPLCLLFLVPKSDPGSSINRKEDTQSESDVVELLPLVNSVNDRIP